MTTKINKVRTLTFEDLPESWKPSTQFSYVEICGTLFPAGKVHSIEECRDVVQNGYGTAILVSYKQGGYVKIQPANHDEVELFWSRYSM